MARSFADAAIQFIADGAAIKPQLAWIEKAIEQSTQRMASAAKTAMLGVTAAAGAIVAGAATLGVLVKLSANAGDEISKLSQRVAIGAETLSGYKLAAELSDLSLQDLGTSLQKASRNIVDAARGTGDAGEAFERLGISVKDNSGKLKTAEQIMLEMADKFMKMEDGAQKTALAMDIFGKSGASMIPLLNQGSAAIAAQRKEAEVLGATWTTAQAKMAEEFNDSLTRVQTGLAGFRNMVVQGLLPILNDALSGFIDRMKEWGASGQLKAWAKATSDAIIGAVVAVAQFIDAHLIGAVEAGTKTFLGMEIAARGAANGVLVLTNGVLGLAWAINAGGLAVRKFLGIEESLGVTTREVEERIDRITTMMAENSGRILEMSQGITRALSDFQTPLSEDMRGRLTNFAETISRIALNIQVWADKAKTGAADAATAVGDAAAKTGQQVAESVKDQVKAIDDAFKALKTRGEATLQQEFEHLQRRAQLFKAGTAERMQAEADAAKFGQDLADQVFAHERALGIRSLEEEIARIKAKVAASLAGTEARMKAEEKLFQLEQELAGRRQQAAGGGGSSSGGLSRFGEDLMTALTPEQRGEKFPGNWNETLKDLFRVGREDLVQKLFDKFGPTGNLNDVFAMQVAAQGMPPHVLDASLLQSAGAGLGDGYTGGMEKVKSSVDEAMTYIEHRTTQANDKILQNMYRGVEEWFVQKLMGQAARD